MSTTPRPIAGKVVAITGAARGIGKATAQALVTRGARVAIGDLDPAMTEQAAEEIGHGTVGLPLNVTDRESFAAFLEEAERQLGPVDVLVNNAGIMPMVRFLEETPESIERQFAVNVMGVINGMQLVMPGMLKRGRGHVVNVSSSAGKFGAPGLANYCGTKHAVVGITDSVRTETLDSGIDFSLVMPAIVETELSTGMPKIRGVKNQTPQDIADGIVEAIETGRYEVWCPRRLSPLYRVKSVLPTRGNDALLKATKATTSIERAIDSPERVAYEQRIEIASGTGQKQLDAGQKD